MRGSDIDMVKNTGPLARSCRRSRGLPETTLSQIWHMPVKTCRLVETRRKILRFVETRRHILSRARISTKNAGPEHFGSNLVKCYAAAFFVEILARPKIWRLISTKCKNLRLVSTRRQVLTGMCQICERVVSGNQRERP